MKHDITVINPEWKVVAVEEDAREILVRHFRAANIVEAAKVATVAARLATKQSLEEQVSCSVDKDRTMVILHTSGSGNIPESIFRLAGDIDSELATSP